MDLFGDLPEPTSSTQTPVTLTSPATVQSTRVSGVKRSIDEVDVPETTTKKATLDVVQLKAYTADRKGERDEMQDAHVVISNFLPEVTIFPSSVTSLSYFAVFDGHGGSRASKYAAEHLHKIIAEKFPKVDTNFDKDMRRVHIESYKKLDENFLLKAKQQKPSWKDGSTAVTVMAVGNTLYIANVGDSKAVLCRYNPTSTKYSAISLSIDHNPTLYEERMRIQKAGGHVREGRVMGQLEVSRSIGDGSFKKHGLSCIPDFKKCQITEDDRYVIVACDGLWKRFENETAIEFVNNILADQNIRATDTKTAEDVRWETACNRLANEAVRRLSADNVTVILIAINWPGKKDSDTREILP